MKRRFDPISSQILAKIESDHVYISHVNKVDNSAATILTTRPDLSSRHQLIQRKQDANLRKMRNMPKKTRKFINERDVESKYPFNVDVRRNIEFQATKFSDSRHAPSEILTKPMFNTVAQNVNYDSEESMDEDEVNQLTQQAQEKEPLCKRVDYSRLPGMEVVDELLKTEFSSDGSDDDNTDL
ncbi:hypothetical protein TVAG_215380 [Trichomonas vaginalis G3]|uniref:Uncharacterized protein n=1 Tax=Trichomonas vaginalis (strain ATCC PRA-98 / G3) TaxID=412133 RepID=A2G3X9_TRIV3|nr:hypothetical protein TVAGG3_0283320 [Trichomonas vaginalis G3]EAX88137.1 hypothetical protein TVAG_215380 [Trichomonas vaginalis G3]KAI5526720.1 hypothetical protein TVAGG3_0283320 [Trichomonas vaginalis G3]|eukprot:XP_001301067.1 hypothetical protein [Trichomonas vaginalis G3]